MAPCVGVDADAVVAYEAFCVGVDAADGDAIVAFGVLCIVEVAATVKSTAVSVAPADKPRPDGIKCFKFVPYELSGEIPQLSKADLHFTKVKV